MSRARKRRFHQKRKAPLIGRFLRRRIGVEQICDDCSKPYLTKPPAQPIEEFIRGSAVASIFVEHGFGKKRFHVRLGRFAANGNEMFISQMIGIDHLEDTARVALMARNFIREQTTFQASKPRRGNSRR